MGGIVSKKKEEPPPPPPPPPRRVTEAEKPKAKPKAPPPPPSAPDEGIFGQARELNTLLLGGEDSTYQFTYTVELDRRQFLTYLTEPRAFKMPDFEKEEDSDDEEETAFQAPLDPRDVLLRQPHEPPGSRPNKAPMLKAGLALSAARSAKNSPAKKKKKKPTTGWRQTNQRVTFKPENAILPGGQYYLGTDEQFTKTYEPWGIKFDLHKFPLQVEKIQSGSVADEHAARHPQDTIETGDLLVEINDMPVCPSAGVYHQRRKTNMSAKEIREEEELAKMSETRLRAREEAFSRKQVEDKPNPVAEGEEGEKKEGEAGAENAEKEKPEENKSLTVAAAEVAPARPRRGSLLLNASSTDWHGYDLSTVARMGPSGNRFGFYHSESDVVKPIDNLAWDQEEAYSRLDVVNKELFDLYYYTPKVKLRFVRMNLPQYDAGHGFSYTLNLVRKRQPAGMQKTPWGIVFHLDWEEIPATEMMGDTFYTNTSGTTSFDDTASVLDSESDPGDRQKQGLDRFVSAAHGQQQHAFGGYQNYEGGHMASEPSSRVRKHPPAHQKKRPLALTDIDEVVEQAADVRSAPRASSSSASSSSSSSRGPSNGLQRGSSSREGEHYAEPPRRRDVSTRGSGYSLDEEEEDEDPEDGMPPSGHLRYNPLSLSHTRRSYEEEDDDLLDTQEHLPESARLPPPAQRPVHHDLPRMKPAETTAAKPRPARRRPGTKEEDEEEDHLHMSYQPTQPFPDSLLGLGGAGEEKGERGEEFTGTAEGSRSVEHTRSSSSSSQPFMRQAPEEPRLIGADHLLNRSTAEGYGFGRNLRLRRVIKVHSIEKSTVASRWNEQDPDVRVLPGDKVMKVQGVDVSSIPWDFLLLPPYPDEEELLAGQEEEERSERAAKRKQDAMAASSTGSFGGGSPLSRYSRRHNEVDVNMTIEDPTPGPAGAAFERKMEEWKLQVVEQFNQHRALSTIFELVIEVLAEPSTQAEATARQKRNSKLPPRLRQRKFRTYLKCKANYFPRDLELEMDLYRYDPEAAIRKHTKQTLRSPRRMLDFMESEGGVKPLPKTQSPQSPMHRPSPPGSPDAGKELALKEMEEEVFTYEAPPTLEVPTALAKSRFKVFLNRSAVDLPWGIYLDERFATLNIYIVQEIEEQAEAPVCQWNEYVQDVGAFGCQLQTGDLVLSFNDKSVWHEAEGEIQHGLRLVLECYRPPYKPCAMTSPPFLQTNEKLLDVCWARSRFLTTVYDDEEALANTPDGGLRDTHYCVVLHSLSPDRWYIVDGATRKAQDISTVCHAIPAPVLSVSVINLPSLRSYEAYVAIRNSQGWSPFSKVSNRERLEKFIQLKIVQKKNDGIAAQIRFVCVLEGPDRAPLFADPDLNAPLHKEGVAAGSIIEGTDLKNGWIRMEKSKGGILWQRYARSEHFMLEAELYKQHKLLVLAPTSFETLVGRFPTDAPRSLEPQPLPISLAGLDRQLVQEHYTTMKEWREYYRRVEREKVEAANAKKVAELLGAAEEQKRLEDEREHRLASQKFFRVNEVLEAVEDGVPRDIKDMFKKRVETSDRAKLDNVTTYKAVLVRKMPEEDWGIKFDPRLEQAGQKVIRNVIIDYKVPNVVTRWNRLQAERRMPYLEVRVGDRLLAVNGKTSIFAMDEQMERSKEIRCEFCRTGDARRPLPDRRHAGNKEELLAGAQFDKDVQVFNSDVMREPHRVLFKSHEPLGFAIDWRSGFPLRVKYVAKGSMALKMGMQENDIIFAINGQEVLKRHFEGPEGTEGCRKQIDPALRERPLEVVLHRAIRFEMLKCFPPRAKTVIRMIVPEGIRLGFTFDVDQMPPPVRHVKPFSRAMRTNVHIADALVAVNGQKVANYMLESYSGITGTGHTILDQLLAERPLELIFERGHYEPPYPENFIITNCGFAYDPETVITFTLGGLVPASFRYEYNPLRDILPRLGAPLPKNLLRKGLREGDFILAIDGIMFYDFENYEHEFPTKLYAPDEKKIKFMLHDEDRMFTIGALRLQSHWRGHHARKNVYANLKAKAIEEKFTKMMMNKMANVVRSEEDEQAIKERMVVKLQKAWRRRQVIKEAKQRAREKEIEAALRGSGGQLMLDEHGNMVPVPVSPHAHILLNKQPTGPLVDIPESEGFSSSGASDQEVIGSTPLALAKPPPFSSYFVKLSREPNQKWGIAFDIDRGILINVTTDGMFASWRDNKVTVGDILYSVNGQVEPRKFYEILASAKDVRVEFRRLRTAENRAPFEATITRQSADEKWGLILDMGTGEITRITDKGPSARYNQEVVRATASKSNCLHPGDKVLAVNKVPLGGQDETMFQGVQLQLFVVPRTFEQLLPSRAAAL
ncbi:unnamed protein product [Amoebophrya sp. A120]|nr:unnamed protein product [Amoebophrya sp. A120]|eukprot:GSA120T00002035001.1